MPEIKLDLDESVEKFYIIKMQVNVPPQAWRIWVKVLWGCDIWVKINRSPNIPLLKLTLLLVTLIVCACR